MAANTKTRSHTRSGRSPAGCAASSPSKMWQQLCTMLIMGRGTTVSCRAVRTYSTSACSLAPKEARISAKSGSSASVATHESK